MVLGVLGIGVDLRAVGQLEACLAGGGDDEGLRDVAVAGLGDHRAGIGPVFLHRQHPAGPEGREGVGQHLVEVAAPDEVVNVAAGHDQIHRAWRRQWAGGGPEAGGLDLAPAGLVAEAAHEPVAVALLFLVVLGIPWVRQRADVAAAGVAGEGRQHFAPVTASRIQFDHHVARPDAPEGEALHRVAPAVARLVLRRAQVAVGGRLQEVLIPDRGRGCLGSGRKGACLGRKSRRRAGEQGQGGARCKAQSHDHSSAPAPQPDPSRPSGART